MNATRRRLTPLPLVAAVLILVTVACIPDPGPAPSLDASNPNSRQPYGWMEAGMVWRGDFPDPDIMKDGNTYYAYGTNAAGRYMPVLMSSDLETWRSPPRYTSAAAPWLGGGDPHVDPAIPVEIRNAGLDDGDTWNLNDGLVAPPAWGSARRARSTACGAMGRSASRTPCFMRVGAAKLPGDIGPTVPTGPTTTIPGVPTTIPVGSPEWTRTEVWGPGVTKIGSRFYAYSAVSVGRPQGVEYGRFCLTVARSANPQGPFRDISGAAPILCDVDPGGSIDPYPFRDPKTGQYWLLWKATGFGGAPGRPSYPSALKAIRLSAAGLPYGPITSLLKTRPKSWEGYSIENPSMVYWQKKYWLFYSGNKFVLWPNGTSNYATGYAVCDSPAGPCRRTSSIPLAASSPSEIGPGGGSPVIDSKGHLRLAVHFFWPGDHRVGGTPRRLKVLTLSRRTPDQLVVVKR